MAGLNFEISIGSTRFAADVKNIVRETGSQFGKLGRDVNKVLDTIADEAEKNGKDMQASMSAAAKQIQFELTASMKRANAAIKQNQQAISDLGAKYDEYHRRALKATGGKAQAFEAEAQKAQETAQRLLEQNAALEESVREYQAVARAVEEVAQARGLETKATNDAANAEENMRMKLRAMQRELQAMAVAGKENTDEYKALQSEAAHLADTLADTQKRISILSNDNSTFQGVISGLSGMAGAASAVTGAYALLGAESEDLQLIQTKLQAALAITNGLQAVASTLNKDSYASIAILGRAKEWYRGILAKTTAGIVAETAATAGSTAAATAGTAATRGLGFAFKFLGNSIKSIPIFGWIVAAIGALVAAYHAFTKDTKAAAKAQQEFNENVAEGAKNNIANLAKLSSEWKALGSNMEQQKKFIEDNKDAFDKLGVSITTVAEAESALVLNTDKLINAMVRRAMASQYETQLQAAAKEAAAAQENIDRAQRQMDENRGAYEREKNYNGAYHSTEYFNYRGAEARRGQAQAELDAAKKKMQEFMKSASAAAREADAMVEAAGLKSAEEVKAAGERLIEGSIKWYNEKISKLRENIEKSTDANEIRRLQEEIAGAELAIAKLDGTTERNLKAVAVQRAEAAVNAERDITERTLAAMEDGLRKELETIRENGKKEKDAIEKEAVALAKEQAKAIDGNDNLYKAYLASARAAIKADERIDLVNAQTAQDIARRVKNNAEAALSEYRDYYDERLAIEAKFHKDEDALRQARNIATSQKERDEYTKALLQLNKDRATTIAGRDLEQLQSGRFVKTALANIEVLSEETLSRLANVVNQWRREHLADIENGLISDDLLHQFENLQTQIGDAIASKNGVSLAAAINDYAAAQERLLKARKAQKEAFSSLAEEQTTLALTAKDSERYAEQTERVAQAKERLAIADAAVVKQETKEAQAQEQLKAMRQQYAEAIGAAAKQIENLGEQIGGVTGEIISLIGSTAEQIPTLVQSCADSIIAIQTGAMTALKAIEFASVILEMISLVMQLSKAIADFFSGRFDEKREQQAAQWQAQADAIMTARKAVADYTLAMREAEIAEQNWANNSSTGAMFANLAANGALLKRAAEEYSATYSRTAWRNGKDGLSGFGAAKALFSERDIIGYTSQKQTYRTYNGGIATINDPNGKAFIQISGMSAQDALWVRSGGKDMLLSEYLAQFGGELKDLFDEDGKLNTAIAERVLQMDVEFLQDSKQILQSLYELQKEVDEYETQLADYVNEMFAGLQDNMVDALFDWLDSGKNVMDSFEEYAAETFRNVAKDMMKNMLYNDLFEGLSDQLRDATRAYFANGATIESSQSYAEELARIMAAFEQEASEKIPIYTEALTAMNEALEGAGYALSGTTEEARQATKRGIATASQESVDENNGRLAMIQAHTYSMNANVEAIANTSGRAASYLQNIETNTALMASILGAIQTQGIKIKS